MNKKEFVAKLLYYLLKCLLLSLLIQFNVNCNETPAFTSSTSDCSAGLGQGLESSKCERRPIKYILYNINPGEGFNLRRDIYVRLAPLIKKLNAKDLKYKWIFVLPVWAHLPHWNTRRIYSWRTFFNVDKINEYIPAIEFEDFIDEYGLRNNIDVIYQLQHFPFNVKEEWKDKIELNVNCQDPVRFQWDGELYSTTLWNHRISATKVECVALRGTASTLLEFLLESNFTSIFFEHAEVILWDSYGDQTWWKARQSLQFSTNLLEIATAFVQTKIPKFNINMQTNVITQNNYIGIHLRRKDFINGKTEKQVPTIASAAFQVYKIMQSTGIYIGFLATDASIQEIEEFQQELENLSTNAKSKVGIFQFTNIDLSQGEIAIVDQILCSWSAYFIGTKDSTFTTRIFEEREILGFDSKLTFNSFCPAIIEVECEQPTQWKFVS